MKGWIIAFATIISASALAGCTQSLATNNAGSTSVSSNKSIKNTHATNAATNQITAGASASAAIAPPKSMILKFAIPSNDGELRVEGYGKPTDLSIYARQLYVVTTDSTPHVVFHYDNSNNLINLNQIAWFGQQDLAFLKLVSITPEEVGGQLTIEQFSQSNSEGWQITSQTSDVVPGAAELYPLDANHLLFESSGLGIQTPVEYTSSLNGVTHHPVAEAYPEQGEIPNSVTRTIHVTGTPATGGTINYKITGDFSTLHMKVGQKLIIRVVYNAKPKLPLGLLMYPDVGDPGPGSLADYDVSPYIDAKVFTMVNTALHGQVVIYPEIIGGVKAGPKTTKGPIKIPIVVQR